MSTVRREGDQSARQVNRSLDSIGSKLTRLGFLAKAAFSSAIVVGARQAVREFALLEGATAKFNVVFGEQSEEMERWVNRIRERVPLATREIIQSTAALQDLLIPMGIARSEAMGMTQEWFELSGALAAFNDVPVEQALQAIQSAIAGQSRPLRQFGIDVRETALQQTALEEGLIKSGEAMTETARQQALLIQAYRQSKDAIDGYEDQLGSTLMIEQNLQATWRDTQAMIGEDLQPAYNDLLRTLTEVLQLYRDLRDPVREATGAMAAFISHIEDHTIFPRVRRQIAGWWEEFNNVRGFLRQLEGEFDRFRETTDKWSMMDDVEDTNDELEEMTKILSDLKPRVEAIVEHEIFDPAEHQRLRQLREEFERFENTLHDIALMDVDFSHRLFPPGSIGAIREEIANLENQLESATEEGRIERLNQRIRELQEELEKLTGMGLEDDFEEMSAASRLFTRTLADGLSQVLFQARSVSDALDGIIRQLGSRALLAGLASLFGGSAVSFGAAFFGGVRSFDGGGFTGRGARSGGLDGKGGFLAMMHPNESVIDHTKNMGLNNVQKIHVHVTGEFQDRGDALRAVVAEQTRIIERLQ